MKICYVSDDYPPSVGGIQNYVSGLVNNIVKSDKVSRVDVLAFCNKGKRVEKVSDKLTVYRFKEHKGPVRGAILFNELGKRRDFDVFHCFTVLPSGFYTSLFTKKSFITVHGLDVLSVFNKPLHKRLAGFVLNKGNIVFNSNNTKKLVSDKYNVRVSKVINPGVSVPGFDNKSVRDLKYKHGIKRGDFVVLFVGRLVKRKGVDDLINAVSMINKENYKLIIVGDGPEKENLVRLVVKNNMSNRVFFAGRVSSVGDYYKLADVFCMPSKYLENSGDVEGLGIVFLEAQSLGIPCIGTFSGGIPEAIKDGYSGFLVKESSPEQIKEKILLLSRNLKLYNKMSRNAVSFSKNFGWDRIVNEHLLFYSSS